MKITKIRLRNLASIEGDAEIDFEKEPLKSTGIFAISGATGSGKSTLLDALCLALYDKTPRFKSTVESAMVPDTLNEAINQNDVRNILRKGTSEGYAEVEFIAIDEYKYRSKWGVRRARNSATGRLQNQSITVYNIDLDKELQGGKTAILTQLQELIGLSYEQFTRTVLLAQNDFSTFLKSKENAKAELLEKLTGTEIYSLISTSIYQRYKEEKSKLEQLELERNLIQLLDEEQLDLHEKEHKALRESSQKLQQELEHIKNINELFKQIESIQKDLTHTQNITKEFALQKDKNQQSIDDKKKEIHTFEEKCLTIQTEIEEAISVDSQLTNLNEQLQKGREQVASATSKVEKSQKEIDEKQLKLNSLTEALNLLYKELQIEPTAENSIEKVILQLESKIKEINETIKELNNSLHKIDVEELNTRRKEIREERTLHTTLVKAFSDFKHNQKDFRSIALEITEVEKRLHEDNKLLRNKNKLLDNETLLLKELEKLYQKVQLQVGSNVEALRAQLKEGDECPVCGSTHHETAHIKTKSQFDVIKNEFIEKREVVTTLQIDIQSLNKNITNNQELLKRHKETYENINRSINALLNQHNEEELNDKFINDRHQQLTQQEDKILKQEELLQGINKERNREIAYKDQLLEKIKKLENFSKSYWEEKSALDFSKKSHLDLVSNKKTVNNEFKIVADQSNNLSSRRQKLLKGMSVKDSKLSIDNHRKKINKELEQLNTQLIQVNNKLSLNNGKLEQLRKNYSELETKVKGYDKEQTEAIFNKTDLNLSEEQKRLADIEYKLKQHYNNEKQRAKLHKSIKDQEDIYEQWAKLSTLFGSATGDKFKVIAQCYTLQILLLHANKHLSYLANRYKLEQVGNSLNLQVIDKDMCDEVRTIYSLSGGESFLISLALALGLSSLSSNNLRVESLFIDEGFGSLDSASLRVAMDALEQLQIQGRKIGVISHVQEMSERIPVQIHLSRRSSGKSTVEILM